MKEIILVKYGEIILKGGNRARFERVLVSNIKNSVRNISEINVRLMQATIYIEVLDESKTDAVIKQLTRVFGIVSITKACVVEKDIEKIKAAASEYCRNELNYRRDPASGGQWLRASGTV